MDLEWIVLEPGEWENDIGPPTWYAVLNYDGIKAYFGEEVDAWVFADMKNGKAT